MRYVVTSMALFFLLAGPVDAGYFADRGQDALDIVTLGFGEGFGAKVQAGPVPLGLLAEAFKAGLRGGQSIDDCGKFGGFPSNFDITLFVIAFEARGGDESGHIRRKNGTPLEKMEPADWTRAEAVVGLIGTCRIGINPGELVDFAGGWFGLDLFGDDLSKLKHPFRIAGHIVDDRGLPVSDVECEIDTEELSQPSYPYTARHKQQKIHLGAAEYAFDIPAVHIVNVRFEKQGYQLTGLHHDVIKPESVKGLQTTGSQKGTIVLLGQEVVLKRDPRKIDFATDTLYPKLQKYSLWQPLDPGRRLFHRDVSSFGTDPHASSLGVTESWPAGCGTTDGPRLYVRFVDDAPALPVAAPSVTAGETTGTDARRYIELAIDDGKDGGFVEVARDIDYNEPGQVKQLREAPATGYQPVFRLAWPDKHLTDRQNQDFTTFYMRLNGFYAKGRSYRARLGSPANREKATDLFVRIEFWVQPDGSRDLRSPE